MTNRTHNAGQASEQRYCHLFENLPIWQVVSKFDAAVQHLSGIITSTVEGEGIGALRALTNADGSTITGRLEILDESTHQQYFLHRVISERK